MNSVYILHALALTLLLELHSFVLSLSVCLYVSTFFHSFPHLLPSLFSTAQAGEFGSGFCIWILTLVLWFFGSGSGSWWWWREEKEKAWSAVTEFKWRRREMRMRDSGFGDSHFSLSLSHSPTLFECVSMCIYIPKVLMTTTHIRTYINTYIHAQTKRTCETIYLS